jgi:hypothetical protein
MIMGCDIHLFVEVRESAGAPWRPVRVEMACGICAATGTIRGEQCFWCDGRTRRAGYHEHNYTLFAMLAGVRNYHDLPSIAPPRGLPEDLSTDLQDIAEERTEYEIADRLYGCGWLGDHSHSWLTVAEIDAGAWDVAEVESGWVDSTQFCVALERGEGRGYGRPNSWSGAVGGGRVEHVTPDVMIKRIAAGTADFCYTEISWQITRRELAGSFIAVFVPALRALGAPENVRIVFGFDS